MQGGEHVALRDYLNPVPVVSPLRKSLQDQGGLRSLMKAQRKTHDETTWGFYDHDDPGEAEGIEEDEQNIVDQEAVVGRPHRPGQHNPRYRKPVEKSDKKTRYNAKYQHPDGTFKGGFDGAVQYFMHVKGYSKAAATKIAGKIAAEKGR